MSQRQLNFPAFRSLEIDAELITRVITVGGRSRSELLDDLSEAGVEINAVGRDLLLDPAFDVPGPQRTVITAEVLVRDLGFPQGARMSDIVERAAGLGLVPCPVVLGPYFRLQFRDQPEGFLGQPTSLHRAPAGSLTVVSFFPRDDDGVLTGFYLRRIEGVLWLRGFTSDDLHVWDPEDKLVFCQRERGADEFVASRRDA